MSQKSSNGGKPQQQTQTKEKAKPAPQVDMRPEPQAGQNAVVPIQRIQTFFAKPETQELIAGHCGIPTGARTQRIIHGLMNAIRTSQDEKLVTCTPQSFLNCIYDAHALGLEIDARQHCYLVRYANEATLSPGYKGYLHKLERSLDGFFHRTILVWPGDHFKKWAENSQEFFEYKPQKSARSDYGLAQEVHCYISYYIHGEKYSYIESMTKEEITLIRSKAKTQKVWNEWMGEQVKKVVLRRACKARFASVVDDLIARDNEEYDLNAGPSPVYGGGDDSGFKPEKRSASARMNDMVRDRGGQVQDAEFTEEKPGAGEDENKPVTEGNDQPASNNDGADIGDNAPAGDHPEEARDMVADDHIVDATDMIDTGAEPVPHAENEGVSWPEWLTWCNDAWDGTLIIGGKPVNKDFNIVQALGYLTQVIGKRTYASVRRRVLAENPIFMSYTARQKPDVFTSLINLADQGAPDDDVSNA